MFSASANSACSAAARLLALVVAAALRLGAVAVGVDTALGCTFAAARRVVLEAMTAGVKGPGLFQRMRRGKKMASEWLRRKRTFQMTRMRDVEVT